MERHSEIFGETKCFLKVTRESGERHSEIFREIFRKMLFELLESIQAALDYIVEKLNA